MSKLDELYKEAGIRETQPGVTPKKKNPALILLINLVVFGIVIYLVVGKGLFTGNKNFLYFFLIIISLLIPVIIRKIIKRN